jgi:hypothetical protein
MKYLIDANVLIAGIIENHVGFAGIGRDAQSGAIAPALQNADAA